MDKKYDEFLKENFGFSNFLAENSTNFEYILGSELQEKGRIITDNRELIPNIGFYIVKLENNKFLFCDETETCYCEIEKPEQYNWHKFGYFIIDDFNNLLEKSE